MFLTSIFHRSSVCHNRCLPNAEKYGGWAPVKNINQISRTARTALLAAALNDEGAKGRDHGEAKEMKAEEDQAASNNKWKKMKGKKGKGFGQRPSDDRMVSCLDRSGNLFDSC